VEELFIAADPPKEEEDTQPHGTGITTSFKYRVTKITVEAALETVAAGEVSVVGRSAPISSSSLRIRYHLERLKQQRAPPPHAQAELPKLSFFFAPGFGNIDRAEGREEGAVEEDEEEEEEVAQNHQCVAADLMKILPQKVRVVLQSLGLGRNTTTTAIGPAPENSANGRQVLQPVDDPGLAIGVRGGKEEGGKGEEAEEVEEEGGGGEEDAEADAIVAAYGELRRTTLSEVLRDLEEPVE
jgi:hypothetical protein